MRVWYWPCSTLRCSHGRTQQDRLLRCCWARSSSLGSRDASSNCCLLSVLRSLHLNSAIRKSLNRSGAIRIAMTTFLCLIDYFRLFIVATGCPSERRPQKTVSCYGGIVQGYSTKLLRIPPGSLTCSAYSTVTRDLGLTSHPKDN